MNVYSEEDNFGLAKSVDHVDEINAEFYSRIKFPWPPVQFEVVEDPGLEAIMTNQEIGSWDHSVIPSDPKIWIGGCGTNQAVFTALKFPNGQVRGSDISRGSLGVCAQTAKNLKISNLELRRESLNEVNYHAEFDYVISTGVIMVNAEPEVPFRRLARALKPGGVMQLMVYNRYHRILSSSFQKAIRILAGNPDAVQYDRELAFTQKLIQSFPARNMMETYLQQFRDCHEAHLADTLLQPVEISYTVKSLAELAERCGLKMSMPCMNIHDKAQETISWNMEFQDSALRARYEALPDQERWQLSNYLMLDRSPMLWFYFQHKDSPNPIKSEQQLAEEFLDTVFDHVRTKQRRFIRQEDGAYLSDGETIDFPVKHSEARIRDILAWVDGKCTMRSIFKKLNMRTDFPQAHWARIRLTTTMFPYLRSVRTHQSTHGGSFVRKPLKEQRSQRLKALKKKRES